MLEAEQDEKLLDDFANACWRAGQSNSGMFISARASGDWEAMQAWRDKLKERLAQLRQAKAHSPAV